MNSRLTILAAAWCASLYTALPAAAQTMVASADAFTELSRMSLEELARAEVTSVSKSAQSLSSAPASIYVITREEIVRTGVLSVPEALRLAPNMQVRQLTSTTYSNGARGFSGAPDVQNFSNKILILIDGRSVYSPLFSGVEYDLQDVLMDDVERIEVISGPGATLWGANAMNGVINIITRRAADSRGTLVRVDAGEEEQALSVRHGGALGEGGAFRVYAKGFERGPSELAGGVSAENDWNRMQGGFRADLARGTHGFTVQGDWQRAELDFGTVRAVASTGANILGRWDHAGGRVATRVQAYFDRVDRERPPDGIAFEIDTWDLEIQQSAAVGERHNLIWGLGRRNNDYATDNNVLAFVPDNGTLAHTNVFIQDHITLSDSFALTAGIKLEDNSYSDWSVLPDVRLSFTPNEGAHFWLAASRAIRAPTPFDVDVQEFVGGQLFLIGDQDFEEEKVTAYELGYRGQPDATVSVSASVFYNEYDDLRTIEITPVTFLPLRWDNLMEGSAYGVEAWASIQLTPWWRLSPGFRSVHKRLEFKPGATALVPVRQAGNDPSSEYSLKSSMDFGAVTADAVLRKVGRLPDPAADDYTELSARIAWRATERLEVAIKGFNLLDETHREYAQPQGHGIRRGVMAELRYHR